MKYLLLLGFAAIVASLASAMFFMLRNGRNGRDERDRRRQGRRMARALALRVGLSLLLFVCLLAAWQLGYIQPTGLPVGGSPKAP